MELSAVQKKDSDGSNELSYTYTDHLGNVAALSYSGGAYRDGSLARYEPYGNYLTEPPEVINPGISDRGFTGHRQNNTGDYDLGLIYMNARYYLPEVGRFISADTIVPEPKDSQSFNRYSYTLNDPVNYVDPTGHCLQYSAETENAELMACVYAWNRLGEYYSSLGNNTSYPGDYMNYLLESASTDQVIELLTSYGIEYKDTRSQLSEGAAAYFAASISGGVGINGKTALIIDVFGNVYLAVGGEIGFKGLAGSLTTGWVKKGYSGTDLETVVVDEAQLQSLLTGWSVSASGGAGVGGSFVGVFGEQNTGYALAETGIYYPPQVGAGGAYSILLYDNSARSNVPAEPTLLNSRFDYWYRYHFRR